MQLNTMQQKNWVAKKLGQYGIAAVGPFGSAAAQFALSLVLLRVTDSTTFGRFSFLLVAAQLSWGVWSALFCAPLPVVLTSSPIKANGALVRALFSANLLGVAAAFFVFLGIGLELQHRLLSAALFAGYGAIALLRWLARAHAYAIGAPLRTAASDILYSLVLLAGVSIIAALSDPTLRLTWGTMLIGTIAGFIPFGRTYADIQFRRVDLRSLRNYAEIWRRHAAWSLVGVFSTEATVNAHAYIVTMVRGPKAFATLAASALLIRPITVAMNALTDFERARMARQIGEGDINGALYSVRFFRLILILIWIGTAALTALLLAWKPGLVFPILYGRHFIAIGACLWMAVTAVRLLRTPESCLLQAAGAFRPLAFASLWSSSVSIVAVLALLLLRGPLWSILGILLGESFMALKIWQQAWRLRKRLIRSAPSICAE